MNPFFFGDGERPLYGAYEPPPSSFGRSRGAVLCYPFANEYLHVHRAFRQLARALARAGVHALRFDYTGTGDSWGTGEDATLPVWIDDIHLAAAELADMSGAARISLVGFRLGASLAALAGSAAPKVDHLVLWDPVLEGRRYLDAVLAKAMTSSRQRERMAPRPEETLSVGGFELTGALARQIAGVDLWTLGSSLPRRVDVVSGARRQDHPSFVARLKEEGVDARLHTVGESGWGVDDEFAAAVLNPEVMREIVASFQDEGDDDSG